MTKTIALSNFFYQLFITIGVTFALAAGVSTMILVFAKKSFSITRYSNIFKKKEYNSEKKFLRSRA